MTPLRTSAQDKFSSHNVSNGQVLYLNQKARAFVERANHMACEIIAKNTRTVYDGPVVIREYHHYSDPFCFHPWYPTWSRPSVVVVPSNDCRSRREKRDETQALIAIGAAIVGSIAVYFLGTGISRWQDASSELEETRAFKREVLENMQAEDIADNQLLIEAMKVADLKERICSRITTSASWDIMLRTTVAASSAFVLGSYFLAPVWMPIGVCGAAIGGLGILFKAGLESGEGQNGKDAESLHFLACTMF